MVQGLASCSRGTEDCAEPCMRGDAIGHSSGCPESPFFGFRGSLQQRDLGQFALGAPDARKDAKK